MRDDFGPDSDIDLLVEFEPDLIPGLLGIASRKLSLSELFAGRKVNLRTAEELSSYFRQEILDKAEVPCARA
ncbi:MAG: nucleotidyltransferase domain-containing protein [Caldilineaceae bacterium]|nr:nucleotidyltransferase domain-containing protein [Caldilineaceae bacterium]